MKLSVLDYGLIDYGKTASDAIQETILLSQEAERLGYHQFWVAEHHGVKAFSISNPELMIMHLANQTKSIKIGSGGIMPLHYSSFKLAETLKTLETCHPNRVSIGLGNSLGTVKVSNALRSLHKAHDYEEVLEELKSWLIDELSSKEPLVQPTLSSFPDLYVLGSGQKSAYLAAKLGLGFTFGVFPFMDKDPLTEAKKLSSLYYHQFEEYYPNKSPNLMVAAFVVIADTSEEAENIAKTLDIWMLGNKDFNEFATFPTIEEANHYQLTPEQKAKIKSNRHRMIVGDPKQVKDSLDALVNASQAEELLLIPLVPGLDQRIKSLKLLSQLY
ncbi:TPA: MsnO8 family LLM class oxidoreductase [Streptococcus agalactiae]